MKALTIWQPWASLIATGEKKYETRNWLTKYRGPIAIHAALRDPCKLKLTPELELHALYNDVIGNWSTLPTGSIIAIGELVNIWRIVHHSGIPIGAESLTADKHAQDLDDFIVPTEKEIALGNWTPGHYAWELHNVKQLPAPIPIKGKQGIWNWESPIISEHSDAQDTFRK